MMSAVARLLLYVGAMVVTGRAVVTMLGARWQLDGRSVHELPLPRWFARGGALMVVLAPLVLLQLQLTALEMTRADLPVLLGETGWGQGWSQLMTACVMASVALVLPAGRSISLLLAFAALSLAVAMGGLGHAAADEQWPVAARVIDAAHVLSMGAWIGGLLFVWSATRTDAAAIPGAWPVFSRVATVMAPVTLLSGVAGSARLLRHATPTAVIASDYGRLLLLKTALVLVVLAIGAVQRRRIQRGEAAVSKSVQVELGVAFGVLLVTALFTGMEPPGE